MNGQLFSESFVTLRAWASMVFVQGSDGTSPTSRWSLALGVIAVQLVADAVRAFIDA